MSLSDYKKKRSFDKTPEPAGATKASGKELRFVVQKHAASHLHYDFRLELRGVLVSWAVPKGPSMNPKDKRLAMKVEDHPYDYRTFEGIIPKGNYGAGTVIVWDEGTYEPAEENTTDLKKREVALARQLHAGHLKIVLHGKKLRGEFAVVHTNNGSSENSWLLIKKEDEFSGAEDITKQDISVISGQTIEQVAKTSTHEWQSNRTADGKIKPEQQEAPKTVDLKQLLAKGIKQATPQSLKPMLATLVREAFDSPDWIYEVKWDGYRALATIVKGKVNLESRNKLPFNEKFAAVTRELEKWSVNAVVDGEVIVLNDKGMADFQLLQSWQKSGKGELVYYVFDILWAEGYNLMKLPLVQRKEILRALMVDNNTIRYSDHLEEKGKSFFEVALKEGLEGVMAKEKSSEYYPGARSQQWLKIKTHKVQEAVIAGFTQARGGRKHFGALILGLYTDGVLTYIGHTGSGMDEEKLDELYSKLQPLITDTCPFPKKPKTNMSPTWVKPNLVCEVKFQEWTKDNILRIPIFLHLRTDKKPAQITRETVIDVELATKAEVPASKKAATKKGAEPRKKPVATKTKPVDAGEDVTPPKKAAASKKKSVVEGPLLSAKDKEKVITISGQELKLTNLDKLYWPVEKYTKRDLLNYYAEVMPYILPYMKDRPQSLNRHPSGITGQSFYQKDTRDKVADWLTKYQYFSESTNETNEYLVCTDEASLLYMANLGCIELNPWHSRTVSADQPDWCVIDLDPDNIDFLRVVETALVVKKILDALDIEAFCKTSGSRGLHIYVPLGAQYNYDQSRQLAELVVNLVHEEIPSFTSIERNPKVRKGKIYLDFLQNRTIQTIAAPYSARPKPGAMVSTPLHWDEVKPGLALADFTMFTIMDRLKAAGDLFAGVLGKGIDLTKVLKKAATIFK